MNPGQTSRLELFKPDTDVDGRAAAVPRHWQTMPHHSYSHAYDFTHTYAYDTETYADSSTSPYPGTATWIAQCQAL